MLCAHALLAVRTPTFVLPPCACAGGAEGEVVGLVRRGAHFTKLTARTARFLSVPGLQRTGARRVGRVHSPRPGLRPAPRRDRPYGSFVPYFVNTAFEQFHAA